jgi:tRNA-Thr(GGU) m(6)t(6)A37 methyltransferase TsaA
MDIPGLGLEVIGVVRSARRRPADTPVQAALNPDEEAVVDLDPAYVEGLDGLAGFDFAWLLTWLGGTGSSRERASEARPNLRPVPFLLGRQPRPIGLFATRGPRRVNPIGLSLVRIVGIEGPMVRFAGVDVVDGTPLLDIKPYVATFDRPPGSVRCGWFDDVTLPPGATPASLAEPG